MPALFLNSGIVFNIAKQASKNAASGSSVVDNALIATVFSVVGMEAFINEAIELASNLVIDKESDPRRVTAFAEMGRQIEESRGSLELKYQVAKWAFSGEAFEKGANPYQDFSLLIAVRNALVHYKLLDKFDVTSEGDLVMETPGVIDRLRSKKVLSDIPNNVTASWVNRISTPAMAKWSCETASAMVKDMARIPSEGLFKFQMGLLSKGFDLQDGS